MTLVEWEKGKEMPRFLSICVMISWTPKMYIGIYLENSQNWQNFHWKSKNYGASQLPDICLYIKVIQAYYRNVSRNSMRAESHDPFMPSRVEDNEFPVVKATVPNDIGSGILLYLTICNICCSSNEGMYF